MTCARTQRVTSSELITGLLLAGPGRGFSIDVDLVDHELSVRRTDGQRRHLAHAPMTVKAFYTELMGILADLDVATEIWPVPVELPDTIPFTEDEGSRLLRPEGRDRVLADPGRVPSGVLGVPGAVRKSSPVHFWGAVDLALTRFSGRPAPARPGGAPNCGPHVMHEAYSHEVSSAGYWPGGEGEGIFYSYAYPEPPSGYRHAPLLPEAARWDEELQEFVLPLHGRA